MGAPRYAQAKDYEAQEQIAVVEWAALAPHPSLPGKVGDYLHATPNGGYKLSPALAKKMKRMGLKAGVSDLFLATAVAPYHGLYVEMKKQRQHFDCNSSIKAAMRASQVEWIDRMTLAGFHGSFAYGAEEAIAIIEEYLHGR